MAESSLSDRACTINPSIQSTLNNLAETIAKITAITQVALYADFGNLSSRIQHDYFCVLSDFVHQAETYCTQLGSVDHCL
jgi:hypothetical protein